MLLKLHFFLKANLGLLLIMVLPCLLIISCKKNNPAESSTPIAPPSKIEIISGNNQVGYPNRPLADSIVIKITPASATDVGAYSPFISVSLNSYVATSVVNGAYYVKFLWELAGAPQNQQLKFSLYANCNGQSGSQNTCIFLDSITVYATIDTNRWQPVFTSTSGSGPGEFWDIHFSDVMNGIVIGDCNTGLAKTTDGGATWNYVNAIRNDFYHLAFSGADTGLAIVTNNFAYFTTDGGLTFTTAPWTPPIMGHLSSMDYLMVNRKTIFSVGLLGNIEKSTDGGQSWIKYTGFNFINQLVSITCSSGTTCYACGEAGKIIKTTDGGNTWKEQETYINNFLRKIYFMNDNFGFAAGEKGALVRTEDGGNTWTSINSGLHFDVIEIHFFSNTMGYIVSTGGEIAKTTDGGLTWKTVVTDNYGVYTLNKVYFKDPTLVYGLQGQAIYKFNLK